MTVTSGFFNSAAGTTDRQYTAEQFGSLFQGIITDGVFSSIGNKLAVSAPGGQSISIASGRAWFNSCWIHNDAVVSIAVPQGHASLNRRDALVIDIDKTGSRAAEFKIIAGTPASAPLPPTLTVSDSHSQHALAYIYVPAGSTNVYPGHIENKIGTITCPYVGVVNPPAGTDTNITAQDSFRVGGLLVKHGTVLPAASSYPAGTVFFKTVYPVTGGNNT